MGYLQTFTRISAEKDSTIIFPLPIDMLKGFNIKYNIGYLHYTGVKNTKRFGFKSQSYSMLKGFNTKLY